MIVPEFELLEILPPCGECGGCSFLARLLAVLVQIDEVYLGLAKRLDPLDRYFWRDMQQIDRDREDARQAIIGPSASLTGCDNPRIAILGSAPVTAEVVHDNAEHEPLPGDYI